MIEKLLEYGLAGAVMGAVMLIVVSPMVKALIDQVRAGNEQLAASAAEIAAQREERREMCERHQRHDEENLKALARLGDALDALVRRANGGH